MLVFSWFEHERKEKENSPGNLVLRHFQLVENGFFVYSINKANKGINKVFKNHSQCYIQYTILVNLSTCLNLMD